MTIARACLNERLREVSGWIKEPVLDLGGEREGDFAEVLWRELPRTVVNISAAHRPDLLARAEALPLRSGLYRTVLLLETLEHVPDPEKLLREAARVLVSGGCLISGASIDRSLLFSGVTAHSYSQITNSVVMPQVDIGRHARINNAIIDRGCRIPPNTIIGMNAEKDKARGFRLTEKGRVLVTREMLDQTNIHPTR